MGGWNSDLKTEFPKMANYWDSHSGDGKGNTRFGETERLSWKKD